MNNQLYNIQALRAISAILVAYYHVQPMINSAYNTDYSINFGAVGVDIFFVISGFIMYYSAYGKANICSFLIGRFFRIVPLYWLSTLILVFFFMVGFRPNGLHFLDADTIWKSLLFIKTTFPDGRVDLILSLGWTLIYEIFFYVVFSLTSVFKSAERSLLALFFFFSILIFFGPYTSPTHPQIKDFFDPIMFEFLYGGVIATCIKNFQGRISGIGVVGKIRISGMLALSVAALVILEVLGLQTPQEWRVLTWGLLAAAIVGCLVLLELSGWRISNGFILLIGNASYSLYLFHPIIMQGSIKILHKYALSNPMLEIITIFLSLIAAILSSIMIYLYIEKYFIRISKNFSKRNICARMNSV
ncbi:acyltransferase [Rhizobium lemnae]|uniref:Acyltransferase family protein n=1 Tax=Rhizobium lemnae TaxID=1214924 RepID=A0ABV8E5Y7_9HYPH|nr:acyltransferase [Rhizobium lemnae]MCJ8510364.1 acyltransferase [Rhizobium lemnae]